MITKLKSALVVASFALFSLSATAADKDIVDTAVAAGNFKTLVIAVQKAGLVETLKDEARSGVRADRRNFAKIPKAQLDALLADKAKLSAVLTYHVVPALVLAKDVKAGEVATVQGGKLTITTDGGVKVNNAKVIATDVMASNGVIHPIDTVLMPK
ncbi:MAG: fasciclin domain-containing protein [Propionivibrio sp.]|uniref:Fasciclin domain-containing protein n=1 Tax=Candidatus Propionivibrio dominans TaxID=2954373 RepID=A0A9D7FIZ8_9RHOO|nr:fasciclin domain-containing protein [Candidatus Propionivibrio dominans]